MDNQETETKKMSVGMITGIIASIITTLFIVGTTAYSYGQQKEFIDASESKIENFQNACEKGDQNHKEAFKDVTDALIKRIEVTEINDRQQDVKLAVFINTMNSVMTQLTEINRKMDKEQ